jgi:hypothetical protein
MEHNFNNTKMENLNEKERVLNYAKELKLPALCGMNSMTLSLWQRMRTGHTGL